MKMDLINNSQETTINDLNTYSDPICKLLYYPYISIPNAAWLTQAILYWDGLATIVPVEYLKYPNRFSSFARDMVKMGIVNAILPEEYAYSNYDKYMLFLEYIEKNREQFLLETPNDKDRVTKQYNLHSGKLGYIGSELVRMGVAKRIDSEWYETKESFAMLFMTFLAILIGQEKNYIPMTDSYRGMSVLFDVDNSIPSRAAKSIRSDTRNSILDHLLPVPTGTTDVLELLRFKELYHDELLRFRRHIESFIISQEQIPEEFRKASAKAFLLDSKDEIKGHMGYFHAPKIDFGTLIAALPSVYSAVKGNSAGAALGIIPIVGELIWNRDRKTNHKKTLAYAALYQHKFRGYIWPAEKRGKRID